MRRTLIIQMILVGIFLVHPLFASTSHAIESREGYALVESVNAGKRTVTLQGETYVMRPRTVLLNAAGRRISLRDLEPIERDDMGFVNVSLSTKVHFEAIFNGRVWYLMRLQVVPNLPH